MKFLAPRRSRMTADYLLGGDKLFSQQAGHDGFGHHTAANEGKSGPLKWVALFMWFLYFDWHIPPSTARIFVLLQPDCVRLEIATSIAQRIRDALLSG
jgi:hypothetical protein